MQPPGSLRLRLPLGGDKAGEAGTPPIGACAPGLGSVLGPPGRGRRGVSMPLPGASFQQLQTLASGGPAATGSSQSGASRVLQTRLFWWKERA